MDLAKLLPVAQELTINSYDGKPTDIVFQVTGHDTKAFREMSKRHAQVHLGQTRPDISALEKQNAELLATCIIGWTGLTDNGEPVPHSYEKALELMLMPELNYIREQVESFVAQRANFFRPSQGQAETAGQTAG